MRVLTIVHDHPSRTTGGTEIAASALSRALAERDGISSRLMAVTTRLHDPDAQPGSLGAEGNDFLLCTGSYDRFTMLRQDGSAWIDALARVLALVRPEVVHLHGVDRLGAEAIPAIRRLAPRARLVMTLHDYQLICPNDGLLLTVPDGMRCKGATPDGCRRCFPELAANRHSLRRAHLLALLRCVDRFVAPSAFLRDRFIAWGLELDRIELIPNAVALPAAGKPTPREHPNRFAFFGNLAPHKGADVLLDAACRLKARGEAVEIALHGGVGPGQEAFRAAVTAAVAEAAPVARIVGRYHRADLPALMAGTDWVIVPSIWWENAPLSILEAKASGLPVIVSSIGGMAELVADGVDGLHVPPGDPLALADVIARAAVDRMLHRKLSRASRVRWSFEDHVEAHLDLFRTLSRRVAA
jgi:glycosyltransferase involved in cell wall biosynthesis